jgi:hypothetical protein
VRGFWSAFSHPNGDTNSSEGKASAAVRYDGSSDLNTRKLGGCGPEFDVRTSNVHIDFGGDERKLQIGTHGER